MSKEDYEEIDASAKKHHQELLYSAMIFTSVMHSSIPEIMNMPYKDYNKLLAYKAEFEQQKQAKMQESTKQSTSKVNNTHTANPLTNAMFNNK